MMDIIRKYRLARGLTQEQLAERAGLSPPYISQLERGKRNASMKTLEDIAQVLDIPIGILLTGFYEDGDADSMMRQMLSGCSAAEQNVVLAVVKALIESLHSN